MSPELASPAAPATAPAPKRSPGPLALFWGMLRRPRATLAYLREQGGISWLWPAALVVVLMVISTAVTAPIAARVGAEQQARLLEERGLDPNAPELQQIQGFAANPLFNIVLPSIIGIVAFALAALLRAGVLHFASLALGGQSRFGAMFGASLWATALPDAARLIVVTLGTVLSGTVRRGGLAVLVPGGEDVLSLDPALGALQAFLGGIDVFWLWETVLTVIAVAVTAQFSWRKGLIVALGYWLLTVLFAVGTTWLSLTATRQFSGLGG